MKPAYDLTGALEKVDFDGTDFVEHVAYNAKGQRLLIAFGNGVMTRYAYDSQTFRLKRQRTETFTETPPTLTYTSGGSVKQDTAYVYDLKGNILRATEKRTGAGFGTTRSGSSGPTPDELVRLFIYDALSRLVTATGREGNNHAHNKFWDDPAPLTPNATNSREYRRTYEYDKMGNITRLSHDAYTNSFTRNYVYTDISVNNQLDKLEDGSLNLLVDYDHDDNGNIKKANTDRYFEWNHTDQLRFFKIDDGSTITKYAQYRYERGEQGAFGF